MNSEYFKSFKCEVLTKDESNKGIINDFKASSYGRKLEEYLKECAWDEDLDGETKIYLVKDTNDKSVLFFSLKCGLLYEPYGYEKIEQDEQDFVNMLLDALKKKDQETINSYYESGYYNQETTDKLFNIAKQRMEIKYEGTEIKDDKSAFKVSKCFSAIELRHFCKNVNYVHDNEITIPLGVGLFWNIVVPKICEITSQIGCKYLYLFAADCTDCNDEIETKRLVQYYKSDLKFYDVQDKVIIKPEYDNYCYGLIQEISDLKKNKEIIWEEFSDV